MPGTNHHNMNPSNAKDISEKPKTAGRRSIRRFIVQGGFLLLGLGVTMSSLSYQNDMRRLEPISASKQLQNIINPNLPSTFLSQELAPHLVDCSAPQSLDATQGDPNRGKQILAHIDRVPNVPPFDIAIHIKSFDKPRWLLYKHGRYYEHNLERAWTRLVQRAPPHSRIWDVGGNIGYYSFLSVAFGKSLVVDTFEPNPLNLLRACETFRHHRLSREFDENNNNKDEEVPGTTTNPAIMNLWKLGISDTKGGLTFQYHPKNPGGGYFVPGGDGAVADATNVGPDPKRDSSAELLQVTTLDDFARARGFLSDDIDEDDGLRIEILKIDVERHEAHVLVGARNLLQRRVIQNVFIEWNGQDERDLHRQALQTLTETGYTLCGWGVSKGPSLGNVPFDNQDRSQVLSNIEKYMSKMKKKHVNLWWQLDNGCNFGA